MKIQNIKIIIIFEKYKSNIKIRNKSKYIRKSNSKFFTESTKMKTSSHSKKISYIDNYIYIF